MRIEVICFSKEGSRRIDEIKSRIDGEIQGFYKSKKFSSDVHERVDEPLTEWTAAHWNSDAIVYISSCGIAVRAIAGCVKDKLTDPAVLVVDEKGRHCISLLSGHVGGANELTIDIAGAVGASPVITTATDVQDLMAIDVWAVKHGYQILNKSAAKDFSASLLQGEPCIVAGVGCRKDTPGDKIQSVLEAACEKAGIRLCHIRQLASIDLKKDEKGLLLLARERKIPFHTYSANELMQVPGDFTASDFVKRTTGADNVCERSALRACKDGILLMKKYADSGVTVAFAFENNGMLGE
ncbi:MAG: cobalamin biosynthesis protein [Eubacterium sp.]|nr:cobalamin biosynthesis protein [Eubacterium sp.]